MPCEDMSNYLSTYVIDLSDEKYGLNIETGMRVAKKKKKLNIDS